MKKALTLFVFMMLHSSAISCAADMDVYGSLRIGTWKQADVDQHNMNKTITEKDMTLDMTDDTTRLGFIVRHDNLTGNIEVKPDSSDHVRQWYVTWRFRGYELLGGKAMTPLNLAYCNMAYGGDMYDSYAAIYELQKEMIQLTLPVGVEIALLKEEPGLIRASSWEDAQAPYTTTETFTVFNAPVETTTEYIDNTDFETFPKIEAGWHIEKWPVILDIVGGFQLSKFTEKETYMNNMGLSISVKTEHRIYSYLIGIGGSYPFSRYYVNMSLAYGKNPGSMGYPTHVISTAVLDDSSPIQSNATGNSIEDIDFSSFFSAFGFRVSQRLDMELGGGWSKGKAKIKSVTYDDKCYHMYVQGVITLAENLTLTPEWGQLARDYKIKDNNDSTEYVGGKGVQDFADDRETYAGVRLQLDF